MGQIGDFLMDASIAGRCDAGPRPHPAPPGLEPGLGGLAGKRALVTGGTRGMGEAVAALLAAHKVRVVVVARTGVSSSPARLIQADLASPGSASLVASEAAGILGGLDILVHCAGASFPKPGGALALTDEDWMQALSTNLLSAVRLDRAVLPGMVEQGSGAIVHVCSLQWKRPHRCRVRHRRRQQPRPMRCVRIVRRHVTCARLRRAPTGQPEAWPRAGACGPRLLLWYPGPL